ncbi:MAG: efflux transporter periplasmic adaptor subunit, partial [Dehalococcoidia bacterium]|nr:efflux transporter periplasmic adaptor subunit [Dehalococcoidia bacterium]
MKLKSIPLFLLLPALMLLLAACGGGSQTADTPTPQAVSPQPSAMTPAVARSEGGRLVISFSP